MPGGPELARTASRNERGSSAEPLRGRGMWIAYDGGSRKGLWRRVFPVEADDAVFRALETLDYGHRITKYEFDSVIGVSADAPADAKRVAPVKPQQLPALRAETRALVAEIVASGANRAGEQLGQEEHDRAQEGLPISAKEGARMRELLNRLAPSAREPGDTPAQIKASKEIQEAVAWANAARPGFRTESKRPCREAVGALGGVERLCRLLGDGRRSISEEAQIQHLLTLGQLCLCPKNAASAARLGALETVKLILSEDSSSSELRTVATKMLSTFSGFCSTASLQMVVDSGITPLLIEVVMAPASQPAVEARTERDERDWSISTLTALARNGALRAELLEAGLMEAFAYILRTESQKLGPKAEKPTEAYIKGSFGLACLVGQEENHPAIGKDLNRCIRWMARHLQAALDAEPWPESSAPTLWVVTHGIASMAIADCNKDKLGEAGVIPLLVRVLLDVDDASTDGAWARENAAAALWALSFSQTNKELLMERKDVLFPVLEKIATQASNFSHTNLGDWRRESICRTARSAANLKFKVEASHDTERRSARESHRATSFGREAGVPALGAGQQLMLSHHPSDRVCATRLKRFLEDSGYHPKTYDNRECFSAVHPVSPRS